MRKSILAALCASLIALPALAADVVRVAVGTTLVQLDPAKSTIGEEYIFVNLVFNGLTRIERDLTVKPDLATSWQASDDLKVWTFKLREGVTFHHGKVLDADDVVATMQRVMDPATGSRGRSFLSFVEKVEAVDPLTVRFTLTTPYAGFADIFGERQLRIVAKDRIADLPTAPSGTGPFKFNEWRPGERMEIVRNPDYFEKGLPKIDGVSILIIPEPAARIASLDGGAIDILWSMPYEAVAKYKGNADIRIDSIATASWDGIIMNNAKKPFDDVRVRRAMAATMDRAAIIDLVLFGQGSPTHTPIPPSHPYFNKSLPFNAPDIPLAKKLLAEAGYPDGIDVTMQVPTERPDRVRLGVVARDMARPAGIRINIERVPFATFTANISGKATLYTDGFFARPSADTAIYPFYHSGGSFNSQLWNYKDEKVDELLSRARRTNDEAARKKIFDEFQSIAVNDAPGIIAYAMAHVNGVRSRVQGFHSTPMQWLDLKEVVIKP